MSDVDRARSDAAPGPTATPGAGAGPDPGTGPGPAGREPAPPGRPDPVVDTRSDDDRDLGWGDDLERAESGGRDARWYEEQRPPHWE